MNWFYNLKMAHKLTLGFGLCLALALLVGGVSISRMAEMIGITKALLAGTVGGDEALMRFQSAARQFRTIEYQHVLSFTLVDKKAEEAALAQEEADAQGALLEYRACLSDAQDRRNLDTLQTEWQQYTVQKAGLLALSRAGDMKSSAALMNGPLQVQFAQINGQLTAMVKWNHDRGAQYARQAQAAYLGACAIVLSLLLLSVLFGSLLAWFITQYITRTLLQISDRLKKLSGLCITNLANAFQAMERGDLTAEILTGTEPLELKTADEFGEMAQTFNIVLEKVKATIESFRKSQGALTRLVRSLQQTTGEVADASSRVSSTAQQVSMTSEEITASMQEVSMASEQSARGASEIATGSSTQAASLAQSSARVKELASTIQNVALDAQKASQATADATGVAQESAQTVSRSVQSMQAIHQTVTQSAEIIQTLGELRGRSAGS